VFTLPRRLCAAALVLVATPAYADIPVPRLAPEPPASSVHVHAAPIAPFDDGRVGFTAVIGGDLESSYRVLAVFAEPGETLTLETSTQTRLGAGNPAQGALSRRHRFTVPQTPGLTPVTLAASDGETMTLNVLVMTRASGDAVGGYHLGAWPAEPYRGEDAYLPPTHFVEGSGALFNLPVSPHFTLGQFLCKQGADGARYLIVSERLLLKLERVLEAANAHGWRTDSFTVMSGFRTPAYNAGIGNGEYSRHIYGGAADIYIDADGDGTMDDLNADGRIDRADAAALFDLVERLAGQPDFAPYLGGLGEYGATAHHPPFVHVDERGWRARWGRAGS
jgi:hypothetical protein